MEAADVISEDDACSMHNHAESCCAHGCGHHHETGEDGVVQYSLPATAGFFLLIALTGEFFGLTNSLVLSACALISACLTGVPIIIHSVRGMLHGRQNVCELAGLAIIAAVCIGEYVAAAEVGLILSLGEIAEEYAYKRSKRDIEKIVDAHPDYGFVQRNGEFVEVAVNEIDVSDIVLVRPGDIFPSDGVIIHGKTSVNESCLTGESIPVEKREGDPVYSGSINTNGPVTTRVTKKGNDSTYSKIVELVREAENRRPPSYPFIEKFASIYTPFTIAVVLVTWLFTGNIERAITILIVACPCALLLSTPSAVISAIGVGAKNGILIKNGLYLEEAAKINHILFDKTGTLTTGKMKVKSVTICNDSSGDSLIRTAAQAESGSPHPLAQAIREFAAERGMNYFNADTKSHRLGRGIKAESESGAVFIGSVKFLEESGIEITGPEREHADKLSESGITPVLVGKDNKIIGIFGIEDTVRDDAGEVIKHLKALGIDDVLLLTGDRKEIAVRVAKRCGIDSKNIYSEILPEEKRAVVASCQKNGITVCFVGDGINDGPALAQANVGVSIGSRENTVAIETSHVILLRDNLASLTDLIRLGRKTAGTIKINVFFALAFTFMLMILAFFGIIHPVLGAIGHQVATLGVLANSALLIKVI